MASERLLLVDPYNKNHIEIIKEFENKNEISHSIVNSYIQKIGKFLTKEEFLKSKKKENSIEEIIVLEKDSQIIDYCHLQGEKDMKTCRITIPILAKEEKKRKILLLATEYAMKTIGMEEVFIGLNPQDQELKKYLSNNGFESLGEEKGNIIYLKDNLERIDTKRKII